MITVLAKGEGSGSSGCWRRWGFRTACGRWTCWPASRHDPEFLAINPAGFIPAIQDGDVTMVESIAIMEYLMARYGPTPLAPAPHDPTFPAYQQFLHLGEAGLAT